jgi:hypothetical protein
MGGQNPSPGAPEVAHVAQQAELRITGVALSGIRTRDCRPAWDCARYPKKEQPRVRSPDKGILSDITDRAGDAFRALHLPPP